MEDFNVLVLPTLEFQNEYEVASSETCNELHKQQELQNLSQEEKIQSKNKFRSLRIKVPCPEEVKDEGNHEDGLKTPTSLDKRTQVPQRCPPAPRKPISKPSTKRKTQCWYIDFSSEVDSLFPAALRADLVGKIKKARTRN